MRRELSKGRNRGPSSNPISETPRPSSLPNVCFRSARSASPFKRRSEEEERLLSCAWNSQPDSVMRVARSSGRRRSGKARLPVIVASRNSEVATAFRHRRDAIERPVVIVDSAAQPGRSRFCEKYDACRRRIRALTAAAAVGNFAARVHGPLVSSGRNIRSRPHRRPLPAAGCAHNVDAKRRLARRVARNFAAPRSSFDAHDLIGRDLRERMAESDLALGAGAQAVNQQIADSAREAATVIAAVRA